MLLVESNSVVHGKPHLPMLKSIKKNMSKGGPITLPAP